MCFWGAHDTTTVLTASVTADREVAPSRFPDMLGYILAVTDLELGPTSKLIRFFKTVLLKVG